MARIFVIACAAAVTLASTASAQTRTFSGEITAGSVAGFIGGFKEIAAHIDLAGPGFHIVGTASEPGRLAGANPCSIWDFPCFSGAEVSLSSFFVSGVSGFLIVNGRVTVNGETLEPAAVTMFWFNFEADPVAIPKGNRKHLVLSTPFVMTSGTPPGDPVIQVEVYRGSFTEPPWAVGQITGDGVVTGIYERSSFRGNGGPKMFHYLLRTIIYSFNAP